VSVRPIDANALKKDLSEFNYDMALRIVDVQPTIEVEPIRCGRMIEGRYPNENKCSECGQEFRDDICFIIQDDDGAFRYPKRCPECGCYWYGGADDAGRK
jgi:hypothetical protein